MSEETLSLEKQQLEEQVRKLQQEIAEMKVEKVAFESQSAMLDNLVMMAETPELEDMLQITIEHALRISNDLTGAEHSCLVLLTERGTVKQTIINHKGLNPEEEKSIVASASNQQYLNWVSRHQKIVLLHDAKTSDRWAITTEAPVVAGCVLSVPILKGTTVMAVVTLIHSQADYFTGETASLMQTLAKQISLAIEFARFYGELEVKTNLLEIEVKKGREMQFNFLPVKESELKPVNPLELEGWDICAFFKPAKQMAGDFYDAFNLPNGLVALVLGDVCDKGVGAALFMGLFRSLLRVFSGSVPGVVLEKYNVGELEKIAPGLENIDPAIKAVTLTNNYIAQNHGELNMFATLFFGLLDPKTGVLTYINGGHEAPVIIRVDGTQERIKATGPVVGPIDGVRFKIKQVELQPGDTLVSFTDGVTDARDPDGAFFTEKRVVSLLKEAKETLAILDSESVISYLVNEIESHVAEANPFDDITMLAIHRASELDK